MTNNNKQRNNFLKELCIALAKCESEKEVIEILEKYGFWSDDKAWCYYGGEDQKNNISIIGNQSSMAEYALVEKITNSIDAVLIGECLNRGISPESDNAPKSKEEALQSFFNVFEGRLINIDPVERTKLAERIKLVATGDKDNPCYTIIDSGEGQTPNRMPYTILSLGRTNKNKIPFVFGRFNQGGTAAFQFCGKLGYGHNIQLVISRRNPHILNNGDGTNEYWGFSVIRRFEPEKGEKNSTFKYLAPNNKILCFKSDTGLTLLPSKKYPDAYGENFDYGTFIKLYEYQIPSNLKSSANLDLSWKLSLLLPTLALPFRIYERRKGYKSHTYEATISGLSVRLDEDRFNNLEKGFPSSDTITVLGHQQIDIQTFAFRKDSSTGRSRKSRYANKEGVLFTIEGQTHGFLPKTFFERKSVGKQYIADSVLVIADCSKLRQRIKEDLFLTSRDRYRKSPLFDSIEKELELLIKNHPGLNALKDKRQREDLKRKLEDSTQLEIALSKIMRISPVLSRLFLTGQRIPNPHKPERVESEVEFKPKRFPTKFELVKQYPITNPKSCPINTRFRVQFLTDVENNYFLREKDQGAFLITSNFEEIVAITGNLWNGIYNLNVSLPNNAKVGDLIKYQTVVKDISQTEPFIGQFYIKVEEAVDRTTTSDGLKRRIRSGKDEKKPGNRGISTSKLAMPDIIPIRQKDWREFEMNKYSSLVVKEIEERKFRFFINLDNIHLQTEIKASPKTDPQLFEIKYKTGMVLVGLSLLNSYYKSNDSDNNLFGMSVYELIPKLTASISPIMIPMINALGSI